MHTRENLFLKLLVDENTQDFADVLTYRWLQFNISSFIIGTQHTTNIIYKYAISNQLTSYFTSLYKHNDLIRTASFGFSPRIVDIIYTYTLVTGVYIDIPIPTYASTYLKQLRRLYIDICYLIYLYVYKVHRVLYTTSTRLGKWRKV